MTVAELIEKLSSMPSGAEVIFERTPDSALRINEVSVEGGPDGSVILTSWDDE